MQAYLFLIMMKRLIFFGPFGVFSVASEINNFEFFEVFCCFTVAKTK